MLSRRYTPPLHPASILDNLLAPEMQQLEFMWPRFLSTFCGTPSTRRHACICCGDRNIDVPQFTAKGEYLCRDCFQQLFFENGDPRETTGSVPTQY